MTRKGELSSAAIDRQWPHQVALPAEACTGSEFIRIREFCQTLTLAPLGHTYVADSQYYSVFCFGERDHAEAFARAFGGTLIDPKQRPKWPGRTR